MSCEEFYGAAFMRSLRVSGVNFDRASLRRRHHPPGLAHLRCSAPGWGSVAPPGLAAGLPRWTAPPALMFRGKSAEGATQPQPGPS
ncbi:MAG: hypothetical protein NTZ50_06365, partial [Chloroflexi bacterium]|nr:hypothetical protein [Chloroflexota bacterium]